MARIIRNVATNWLGFAVSAAVTLLLTPIVLHDLGISRYGIWVLTSSIVGYYGVMDLGFRAGLMQHLTRQLALGEYKVAREYLNSALVAMGCFAALIAVCSLLGAWLSARLFDIPEELRSEAFWCILIVGLGSSAQFALFPFATVFPAAERFDIASYIGIATRLLGAACVYLALKMDFGLVGVSLATFFANFVDYMFRWRLSRLIVPSLFAQRASVRMSRLKDIMSFGIWNFLVSINEYAYQHAPSLIIASFLKVSGVGYYSLATGMIQQIISLMMPIGQVLYPVAVGLNAQGDNKGLERLYHDGTRLVMVIMVCVVAVAGTVAQDFYLLWIGPEFISGEEFHSVALLLQILLASVFTSFTANIGLEILKGTGYVRMMAMMLICGTVMSIGMSMLLISHYGLLGIVVAVVAASVIVDLIAVPIVIQRILNLSVTTWLLNACLRPVLVLTINLMVLGQYGLLIDPGNWIEFIGFAAGAATLCAVSAVLIGLKQSERIRFIYTPAAKLLFYAGRRQQ